MKFGFKLGKSKDKTATEELSQEQLAAELLENTEEEAPVRHNAPIQELTLDNEGGEGESDAIGAVEIGDAAEDQTGAIKLVEVQVDAEATPVPPPPAEIKAEVKQEEQPKDPSKLDIASSISEIFTNIEDEENPLANLIKSLPDVAAAEILDDLKEINDIIKDWQKK